MNKLQKTTKKKTAIRLIQPDVARRHPSGKGSVVHAPTVGVRPTDRV